MNRNFRPAKTTRPLVPGPSSESNQQSRCSQALHRTVPLLVSPTQIPDGWVFVRSPSGSSRPGLVRAPEIRRLLGNVIRQLKTELLSQFSWRSQHQECSEKCCMRREISGPQQRMPQRLDANEDHRNLAYGPGWSQSLHEFLRTDRGECFQDSDVQAKWQRLRRDTPEPGIASRFAPL